MTHHLPGFAHCPTCGGTGEEWTPDPHRCTDCDGTGVTPAPDPGQRYRLTPDAAAAVTHATTTGPRSPQPYLTLLPDGVTLDLCPPPAGPPETQHSRHPNAAPASAPSKPDTHPATAAASPSTTPSAATTPDGGSATKSTPATSEATPPTPATSSPPTGAATPKPEPTSPTPNAQPDDGPAPARPWSTTTGDRHPAMPPDLTPPEGVHDRIPLSRILDALGWPPEDNQQ